VTDLVQVRRAARARHAAIIEPHGMTNDQLPPSLEEVNQAKLAARAVQTAEHVFLAELDHRQQAAPGADRVPGPGERLLLRQQRPPGGQPLLARDHGRQTHSTSSFLTSRLFHSAGGSAMLSPARPPATLRRYS
jgi:hypothetical protein